MPATTFFVDHKSVESILWVFGPVDVLRWRWLELDGPPRFAMEAHRVDA